MTSHIVIAPLPEEKEKEEEEEDLDADVREKLSDEEGEIRSYLLHGDPLSEETIEKYTPQFWNSEPYKLAFQLFPLTHSVYSSTSGSL